MDMSYLRFPDFDNPISLENLATGMPDSIFFLSARRTCHSHALAYILFLAQPTDLLTTKSTSCPDVKHSWMVVSQIPQVCVWTAK